MLRSSLGEPHICGGTITGTSSDIDQPTILREYRSRITARYSQPSSMEM